MDNEEDYWTNVTNPSPPEQIPPLKVETVESVGPLDAQFGVAEPLTVPETLQNVMFGQPAPSKADIAAHGGDPARVPPLHTYAILDAAKVANLPEMLETSGLPHRCLFKGDAFDELKDAAPWIVQMEDGNAFTRNLFTRSDAPWHLWDCDPGIYLRSRGTLDEMWQHFRKFTKIKNGAGKWYYWRFWEPKTMTYYLDGVSASQARVQQIFMLNSGIPVPSIVAPSPKERCVAVFSFSANPMEQNAKSHGGEILELDPRYTQSFLEASIDLLRKYTPELDDKSDRDLMVLARQNVVSFHQFGFVSKPVIASVLAVIALCGHPLERLPAPDQNLLRDNQQSQFRRTSILLHQIKYRRYTQHG